jgi:hypothetical protein
MLSFPSSAKSNTPCIAEMTSLRGRTMFSTVILQLLITGVTQLPAPLDLQSVHDMNAVQGTAQHTLTVAFNPIHGPDPNREIHDNGLPINNRDPYGGTVGNGSDPYGGRFGGNDPYGGRTDNGRDPYAGRF